MGDQETKPGCVLEGVQIDHAVLTMVPDIGELIYGCFHQTACGTVAVVIGPPPVVGDACGRCCLVHENWMNRLVRVRREANNRLYEVEVASASR